VLVPSAIHGMRFPSLAFPIDQLGETGVPRATWRDFRDFWGLATVKIGGGFALR